MSLDSGLDGGHHREDQIDRRNLLKKAGAAGAFAWTAPILFDSVLSPAAACSIPVTSSLLTSFISTADSTTYTTSTFTATSGRLVAITVAISFESSQAPMTLTIGGTAITGAATFQSSITYDQTSSRRQKLFAFTATGSGVAGDLVLQFSGTATTIQLDAAQFSSGNSPVSIAQVAAAQGGPGTTATVNFTNAPAPGSAQVTTFAGRANTSHSWATPGTELSDDYVDGGLVGRRFSLATSWDTTASPSNSATATTTVDKWGAIALELACPAP